jgi:glycolate oxidase
VNLELITELKNELGPEVVFDTPEVVKEFERDITENKSAKPDLVIYVKSVEQIQKVLAFANQHRIPVVPVMANTNVGGLAIPVRGGIILNLSKMNRILEVNQADQYAVIEPGVTWQQIHDHLESNYPDLRFAYPLSPPDSGVIPNFIMDGLVNLSLRHGSAAHWINGLEVVLPDGRLLHTGHWAFGSLPCTNSPFPGLEGLFIGFQGTTGIVTKMAVQLWPSRRFRRRIFLFAYDAGQGFELLNRLSKEDLVDDLGGLSLPTGKMLFGEYRPLYKDPNEPLMFIYIDISSNFRKDFESKLEIVNQLKDQAIAQGARFEGPLGLDDLVKIEPRFKTFAKFPTRLDFLLDHPGGGLSWIGTYGPTSRYAQGFIQGSAIMKKHGFPPLIVARPMRGGHFGVLRWISVFNRDDPEDTEAVRQMNLELADMAVELGFFPYKTPQWIWERFTDKIDPTFFQLIRQVRKMLDPNGIMNPGHLEISQ